jgi:hypothetical protein
MGSLARVLFAEARPKGGETDTDEPDGAARDKIEARKRFEQERKSRAFD